MQSVYTIYLAENKADGNKPYIGFDSHWPRRKISHIRANGNCPKFHSAIKKYGHENFQWTVLYQSKDKEFCSEMEKHFIAEYDSTNKGYNLSLGGLVTNHSDEVKSKISKSHIGKKHTPETKEKMRLARLGKTSPRKGVKVSDETRLKMSLSHFGNKSGLGNKGKIVSKETGRKISDSLHKYNQSKQKEVSQCQVST